MGGGHGEHIGHERAYYKSSAVLPFRFTWASLLPRDPLLHDTIYCDHLGEGRRRKSTPNHEVIKWVRSHPPGGSSVGPSISG
jgi:hypothetical protein